MPHLKTIILTWLFVSCLIAGPDVASPHWDITDDGHFDLRDVAVVQNGTFLEGKKVKHWVELVCDVP